jgi:hypothetical protein
MTSLRRRKYIPEYSSWHRSCSALLHLKWAQELVPGSVGTTQYLRNACLVPSFINDTTLDVADVIKQFQESAQSNGVRPYSPLIFLMAKIQCRNFPSFQWMRDWMLQADFCQEELTNRYSHRRTDTYISKGRCSLEQSTKRWMVVGAQTEGIFERK